MTHLFSPYRPYFLFIISIFLSSCSRSVSDQPTSPRRIVSLAPSITETLFALGLGDLVVGVTSYCHYPPRVDSIEKIGGYADANLERVVTLKPDLIILQREHRRHALFFERYGIEVMAVNYASMATICTTFSRIGKRCDASRQADSLIHLFQSALTSNDSDSTAPSVLLCVGRAGTGTRGTGSVFIAGVQTFYNDIITAAGGVNAFPHAGPAYPKLSEEGLLTLKPDIIVDIAAAMDSYACSTLVSGWQGMTRLPAVRNKRVHCIAADYATIPGPRVIRFVDDLRRIIGNSDR